MKLKIKNDKIYTIEETPREIKELKSGYIYTNYLGVLYGFTYTANGYWFISKVGQTIIEDMDVNVSHNNFYDIIDTKYIKYYHYFNEFDGFINYIEKWKKRKENKIEDLNIKQIKEITELVKNGKSMAYISGMYCISNNEIKKLFNNRPLMEFKLESKNKSSQVIFNSLK